MKLETFANEAAVYAETVGIAWGNIAHFCEIGDLTAAREELKILVDLVQALEAKTIDFKGEWDKVKFAQVIA